MISAKYQSGTSFCIEIFDSTSRTCMTVADAVRLKEELTKAIDDAEKDKKEEPSEFALALRNAMADTIVLAEEKDDDEMSEIADKQAKRYSAELLAIAKEQLNIENLKERAVELTKQLNESGLDENSIEYDLIEFMCNLMDCPNWSEIVETAGLYAGRIKAEALKNLPRWKRSLMPHLSTEVKNYALEGYDTELWLLHSGRKINIKSLEKIPGFKED